MTNDPNGATAEGMSGRTCGEAAISKPHDVLGVIDRLDECRYRTTALMLMAGDKGGPEGQAFNVVLDDLRAALDVAVQALDDIRMKQGGE